MKAKIFEDPDGLKGFSQQRNHQNQNFNKIKQDGTWSKKRKVQKFENSR